MKPPQPDPYSVLGVDKQATKEQIKEAYKTAAKRTHPDTPKGSTRKFQAVERAYHTLKDEQRRKHWDETGQEQPLITIQEEAEQMLTNMLVQAVVQLDRFEKIDILQNIKATLRHNFEQETEKQKLMAEQMVKLNKVSKRLMRKQGTNILSERLVQTVRQIKDAILQVDHTMDVITKAETIIEEYRYDFDKQTQYPFNSFTKLHFYANIK